MHPLFFGVKRLNRAMRGLTFYMLVDVDDRMTPAQFDLLRTLSEYPHGIARWKLVKLLGVSGPVVSRMMRALEDRQLLTRERYPDDRRVVLVKISEHGAGIVGEVLAHDGEADQWMRQALVTRPSACVDVPRETPDEERRKIDDLASWELQIFERFLVRARIRLDDRTPFTHPWFTGEIVSPYGYVELLPPKGTFDGPSPTQNLRLTWEMVFGGAPMTAS